MGIQPVYREVLDSQITIACCQKIVGIGFDYIPAGEMISSSTLELCEPFKNWGG